MAQHHYTFLQLKQAAQHAAGIATPATGSSWDDVVNDAVQYMAGLRPWTWLHRPLSLDFVQDTTYVVLPEDFGRLHVLKRASSWVEALPKSLDKILELRHTSAVAMATEGVYYALTAAPQASADVAPTWRLELYPTPSATEAGALVGTYFREVPAMSQDTDVPDVPAGPWAVALKSLVRAMAISGENEQIGPDWALFNQMLPSLIDLDGTATPNLGPLRGAAVGGRSYNSIFANRTINQAP